MYEYIHKIGWYHGLVRSYIMDVFLLKKGIDMIEKNKKCEKLYKSLENNIKISEKNLGKKFANFEDSRLDESVTLLYEIEKQPTKFQRYARGQIVRVKFGVNIGSEFSGDHFAIVVSKGDTMMNSVFMLFLFLLKNINILIMLEVYYMMKMVLKI